MQCTLLQGKFATMVEADFLLAMADVVWCNNLLFAADDQAHLADRFQRVTKPGCRIAATKNIWSTKRESTTRKKLRSGVFA